MKNLTFLSHEFDVNTPGYGGSVAFERSPLSSFQTGQSSQSEKWSFKNHSGTHMDFPLHFFAEGQSLSSYEAHHFHFKKAALIDAAFDENQIIRSQDLITLCLSTDPSTEMLLFRTGFEKRRSEEVYWKNNPGFHPETADYLREKFPNLRAIGFDFISLTAYQQRELGREAHRQFLNPKMPIWIIEDMKLAHCQMKEFEVLIAPFPVANADGTPVGIYAFARS
ncbi:MAG: cyclase family protein [Pseudobdellovibrionaceae bacterium]